MQECKWGEGDKKRQFIFFLHFIGQSKSHDQIQNQLGELYVLSLSYWEALKSYIVKAVGM